MSILSRAIGIAPEFNGVIMWLNSKPLKLRDLKGKVMLVDFWTYSCINCIRTLPGLRALWERYKNHGLVIIGIHSPEFEFEKNIENIEVALKKYKIIYPIAVDSNHAMWNAYLNQYWPAHYLVDKNGKIRYTHFGEGGEEAIEMKIRDLLKEAGYKLPEPLNKKFQEPIYGIITRETYCGFGRGEIGGSRVCTLEGCKFIDQGEHREGIPYPSGEWEQENEYLEFKSKKEPGYLLLKLRAKETNLVMGISNKKVEAEVLLNNKPLTKSNAGSDVYFRNKKSYIKVNHYDMYNLLKESKITFGEISIVVSKHGLRCYAYTFG